MKVILDSGHNKSTAGKRAFDNSFYEYEFNYDVANRIKGYLTIHGIDVEILQMNISNSNFEVNSRVEFINNSDADIVVSIHANAYGSTWNTANGWEIFCYKTDAESVRLAECILKQSIPYLGIKNRGIKDGSNLALVGKTDPTAVLIEHGFYTNVEELKLLKSDAFREKCAIADAKGICAYFNIPWIDNSKIYKVQVGRNYTNKKDAEAMKDKLVKAGFPVVIIETEK